MYAFNFIEVLGPISTAITEKTISVDISGQY